LDLDELYTAIEAAEQSVDALWNLAVDEPYPQQRMKQLLNCIGGFKFLNLCFYSKG